MRKLLGMALAVATCGFIAGPAEAKAASASVSTASAATSYAPEPQWGTRNRRQVRRDNRRARVTTQTRLVRRGRAVYRETYQIRYLPNGRTQTRLISRVRVR
jgi:hypothetical protein